MKLLLLGLVSCIALSAQTFSFYVDASSGANQVSSLAPLSIPFSFPDTAVGNPSSVIIRVVNTGSVQAPLNVIFVSSAANSASATPNFSVTGFQNSAIIAPGDFKLFTVNFTPSSLGSLSGYLQGNDGTRTFAIATLNGNGLPPQITLSCTSTLASQCNGGTLQPNSASILDFGSVSTLSSLSIPFTLTNNTSAAVNPQSLIAIAITTNNPNSSFSFTSLPNTLDAGSSVNFNLVFAPGAAGTYRTNLLVGSSVYPIQATGTASVLGDLSSLVITYTDPTGVRLTAQPSSAIDFGNAIVGGTNSNALTFSVANPQTTVQAISVATIGVSGTGYTLTAPALPVNIAPGTSATFKIVFTPTTTGAYPGVLTIGTRQFNLSGKGTASPLAGASFQVDLNPLVNQKQAHLTVNLASPSPIATVGTLTMTFTPSIAIAQNDPAMMFLSTGTRQLNVSVAQGSQTATYLGQSALGFQTGTTAGTIKFSLDFPGLLTYNQSYTLTPAPIVITSATAASQVPYLVVSMTGYDNTYSAGKMTFLFYDTAGKAITANPLAVDATTAFQNYFASSTNQAGGAFNVQLKFPITGDITRIGNLGIVVTNSAGSTNVKSTN